jgi:hypothetical protein
MRNELDKQFEVINNIVTSNIPTSIQISLCKQKWNEFDNNNKFISNSDIDLMDLKEVSKDEKTNKKRKGKKI